MLASLRLDTKRRPLVAVIGINDATETTDYLMPTGILRRAGVAEVVTVSTEPGPVKLYPALTVEADATIREFDERNPQGADYVIVPAMSRDNDPKALAWIKSQADKGARVIAVCAGAKVVASAGLLDGRRATTHWYYLKGMLERHPSIIYAADRRMVIDQGVATTTGITASMPMMLTLIEAIAGRQHAVETGNMLGLSVWDARHASSSFRLTRSFATTVLGNTLAFWKWEQIGVELRPGMDEVSLALVADAWSRTYRSKVGAFAPSASGVVTRNGIRVIPDQTPSGWSPKTHIYSVSGQKPVDALDKALLAIATAYGNTTANVVAMQLEYPAS